MPPFARTARVISDTRRSHRTWRDVTTVLDALDIETRSLDRLALLGSAAGDAAMKSSAMPRLRVEVDKLLRRPSRQTLRTAAILVKILEAHDEPVGALPLTIDAAVDALPSSHPGVGSWTTIPELDERAFRAARAPGALIDFAVVRLVGAAAGRSYFVRQEAWKRSGTPEAVASTLAALPDRAVRERTVALRLLADLPPSEVSLEIVNAEIRRTRGFASSEQQLGFVLEAASLWRTLKPAGSRLEPASDIPAQLRQKVEWAANDGHGIASLECGCEGTARCHWPMPVYSQNDCNIGSEWLPDGPGGSMLCAPTAAAMCLAANLFAAPPSGTTPWIDNFHSEDMIDRIIRMAELFGTDPDGGTDRSETISNFSPLRVQMTYNGATPKAFSVEPTFNRHARTPPSLLRHCLQTTPGILVHFGRYIERKTIIRMPGLRVRCVEYERDGGHLIALRGHDGDLFEFNDPWQGDHRWDTLAECRGGIDVSESGGVKHVNAVFLPNDSAVRYYFPSCEKRGDVPFIDLIGGISNAGM